MNDQPSYSKHQATIVALVTHLALTKWKSRTPSRMANSLGLEDQEVRLVLEKFKDLFRKSKRHDPNNNEPYYTLQAKYAIRSYQDPGFQETQEIASQPLDMKDTDIILQHIKDAVDREHKSKHQDSANRTNLKTAWIGAAAIIVAAVIVALIAYISTLP